MTKHLTERLEEKAKEISQKMYLKERERRGAGNIEKMKEIRKLRISEVLHPENRKKRSQLVSSQVKA